MNEENTTPKRPEPITSLQVTTLNPDTNVVGTMVIGPEMIALLCKQMKMTTTALVLHLRRYPLLVMDKPQRMNLTAESQPQ